jgi:2,4-dienoyl-CoA reductase-like NADH-dependent reductase (Old Yellow Enzyme family)
VGPSGVGLDGNPAGEVLTPDVIEAIIGAYADAAKFCQQIGFDGIEVHGAHGYLLDQFLWARTNLRSDNFADPLLFPTRVVSAIRAAVGPDFPIVFRFSQWKTDHYDVRLAGTPEELGVILGALHTAGVDMFHPSTRRFWEPAFPEADGQLTLAGWTRKLTGAPTIIVGSVGLDRVFMDSDNRGDPASAKVTDLDQLLDLFDKGHFDVVAVGRALLSEPEWVRKHASNRMEEIQPYARHFREVLS